MPHQSLLSARPQGVCIFLTGLSGAGKSTIASALAEAVEARLARPVTLLDGDVVRTHLSRELGFSRTDRDTNIERIAFVAAEVVKHGGVVISAAIAPYDGARLKARERIAKHGRFVLVHLSTPLSVCEGRDVKGLYAKARRGEIAMFTGVSDAYEAPSVAELTIDTSSTSVDDAVAQLLTEIAKDEA
jgi:sulfate adenylyltransferase